MEDFKEKFYLEFKSDRRNWSLLINILKEVESENQLDLLKELLSECEVIFEGKEGFNRLSDFVNLMYIIDKDRAKEWLNKSIPLIRYSDNHYKLACISYQKYNDLDTFITLINNAFELIFDDFFEGEIMGTTRIEDLMIESCSLYCNSKDGVFDEKLKMALNPIYKKAIIFMEEECKDYEVVINYLEDKDFGFQDEVEWIERINKKI